MNRFAAQTGRAYHLFDYYGAADAERVIIMMGSGAEAAEEAVDALDKQGEKIGLLKVRLYRPFDASAFIDALPATVKSIAVLDRCKEPGAAGEPLYQDIVTVLAENAETLPFAAMPTIIGGRYGLSSKEFTPAMVKGIFDELDKDRRRRTTSPSASKTTSRSPASTYDPEFSTEDPRTVRALFYGLGSDGTVGANKNSIKIIGDQTPNYAQGYFVYDSKKSGSMTTSHLRFGPNPIRSTYLITRASFIACHNFSFLEKMNVLEAAMPGAVFLLNSPYPAAEVWDKLPKTTQQEIIRKKIEFYVIDGYKVAREAGMGTRINTIMQTCFFAISGVLPREEAIEQIKKAIKKTYGKRGEAVVNKNFAAVDAALAHLEKVELPAAASSDFDIDPASISDQGAGIRARRARQDRSRPGRPASGQRTSGRRHIPDRHGAMGEAQHRAVHPRVGQGSLHPVRQVRHGLPARRDPRQGLQPRTRRQGSRDLQVGQAEVEGHGEPIATRCRLRRKIAPAAPSASKSAR